MSNICQNFLLFFLIFWTNISLTKNLPITITFNLYQPKVDISLTKEKIYESIEQNYLYSYFSIGNPQNKIPFLYTFNNSLLSINSDFNIKSLLKSTYIPSNSKSFKKLSDNKIQEEIEINEKIIKNFTFLYQNNIEKEQNLFGCIGLQNFYTQYKANNSYNQNFLYQLKNLGLIENISYNIYYKSEKEGYLYINTEPYNYSPKIFSNTKKHTTFVKELTSKEEKYLWNIDINSLYYINNGNKIIINNGGNNVTALLDPQYGLIKGCLPYKDIIEKNILHNFIENNICSISEINEKIFYSCKSSSKKDIKEVFPTLYLYQSNFNYTFELNFYDLFYEKNDILYFLICFDKNNKNNEWVLGKPFMKKYQFSFNVEKNEISFYENLNILKLNEYNNDLYVKYLLPTKNLIMISLSMFIIFISFLCVFYCLKMNNKAPKKQKKQKIENGKKFLELKESNVIIN